MTIVKLAQPGQKPKRPGKLLAPQSPWEAPPPHTGEVLGEQGDPNAHAALLGMLFPGFSERYAERIGPQVMEVAENLVERASDYLGNREGPVALVHRDFRPDNLLVDDDGRLLRRGDRGQRQQVER